MKLKSTLALAVLLAALSGTASAAEMMKAVVVTDGKASVQSVPRPEAAAGEVRVRVRAAGMNPVDWARPREGSIPGFDAAGVIDALGAGVSGWKVGDEVIVFSDRTAAYAQYVAVPLSGLALKPKALSFEEAAGIPTVVYAAWWAIVDAADVKPGQRVLIHGASGGTGSAAVQLAKWKGAYVIATASKSNHEFLKSIGADETIDYTTEKFEDKIKQPVDVSFNNVDADTATRSIAVTKRGGVVVSITGTPDATKAATAGVRTMNRGRGTSIAEIMKQTADLTVAGKYKVNVDKTYTLEQVNEAWESGRQRHTRGKLILKVD